MSKIESIKRVINEEQDGKLVRVNRIEYDFTDDATEWEKEAVREFGCTSKDEFEAAITWRKAIDDLDNEQAGRVMRGKHPKDEIKKIGRAKNTGNSPDHTGPS